MEENNLQEIMQPLEENTPQQDQVLEEQVAAQAQPTQQELNIRELRKKAERLERERNDYYQQLQQAQKPQDAKLNSDDLVEAKHLYALREEMNQKYAETYLKMSYPDFDAVVNSDTINLLKAEYPEVAASINSNPDLYSKASAAYKLIKKLNIIPDDATLQDRYSVTKNTQKPRPVSSIAPQTGETPLTKANAFAQGLTPELKKQLYQEMINSKKG